MRIIARAALAALAIVPAAAYADECTDRLGVFSGRAGIPKANVHAIACNVDADAIDSRLINPGSNEIAVRYTIDYGPTVPSITVRIDGLGFANKAAALARTQVSLSPGNQLCATPVATQTCSWVYQSANLPLDSAATGCITVKLYQGDKVISDTTFHTLNATC